MFKWSKLEVYSNIWWSCPLKKKVWIANTPYAVGPKFLINSILNKYFKKCSACFLLHIFVSAVITFSMFTKVFPSFPNLLSLLSLLVEYHFPSLYPSWGSRYLSLSLFSKGLLLLELWQCSTIFCLIGNWLPGVAYTPQSFQTVFCAILRGVTCTAKSWLQSPLLSVNSSE